MANSVFMHKIVKNTIVCVTEKLSTVEQSINGQKVHVRTQADRSFGLLCLVDDKGKTLDPLTLGLKQGDEIPGFKMSDQAVLDQDTKEPTGLFWVEAA